MGFWAGGGVAGEGRAGSGDRAGGGGRMGPRGGRGGQAIAARGSAPPTTRVGLRLSPKKRMPQSTVNTGATLLKAATWLESSRRSEKFWRARLVGVMSRARTPRLIHAWRDAWPSIGSQL